MENLINDRNNEKLIKALTVVGTIMWALPIFSTTAYAEECLLDDGFLPGFADGFDTTGGADGSGGASATACGAASVATGANSSAFGGAASATGAAAVANGWQSMASAENSTALGANSVAGHDNSTALGAGAATTRANQVVLGTTSSTITAPGITSAASLAAQGAVVGLVTTDADGNLASDGGALQNQVNTNSADILSLKNMTTNLSRDIEENTEGVAMAFALKSAYVPQDKTFAMTGGVGFFQDKAAFASSVGYRLNPNLQLDAGLSVGFDSGNVGGRVGATITW